METPYSVRERFRFMMGKICGTNKEKNDSVGNRMGMMQMEGSDGVMWWGRIPPFREEKMWRMIGRR
jgi:hypothetical protein